MYVTLYMQRKKKRGNVEEGLQSVPSSTSNMDKIHLLKGYLTASK